MVDIISTWIAGLALLGVNYYIIVIVGFAYAGWDKLIRKKYVLHLVQEEGQTLQEVKSFSKPMKISGKTLDFGGRTHIVDPHEVLFTDKYNKRHIIHSVDNVFGFHPYSDTAGKIQFKTIAIASAEHLHDVISKKGFMTKLNGLSQTLGGTSKGQSIMMIIVGVAIAVIAVQFSPQTFGLEHTVSQPISNITTQITTAITSTTRTVSNPFG